MTNSVRTRFYAGFTVALLLAATVGIISYRAFQKQVEDSKWVDHSHEVKASVERVRQMLIDMENSRRAFRFSNQKRFLDDYYINTSKIQLEINDLRKLTADNLEQLAREEKMQRYVDVLRQFWRNVGEDVSTLSKAQIIALTDNESQLMGVAAAQLTEISENEDILLAARKKKMLASNEIAAVESIGGTLVVEIIIILLVIYIVREFKRRRETNTALEKSNSELGKIIEESNRKNWLLTGLSSINACLRGTDNTDTLSQLVLDAITKYAGMPAGALYVFEEEHQRLRMCAEVALPGTVRKIYALTEGIPGHAATSTEITIINSVPAEYWQLQSGVGKTTPGNIICVPLWYNDELKGLLELASFTPFGEQHITLLQSTANSIAIAINAADAREKVMKLLAQVQEQKEILQNQEEELKQSNEELTKQAEILQASEEELRVQEEELRQSNADLEEKNEAVEIARVQLAEKAEELEIIGKYKSEFLANMSHELRTPLNSILILAKMLSENKTQNLNPKQTEYATIIHKSGTDLLGIINDILDLSKIEAGKIDFHFEDVKIGNVVHNIKQLFGVLVDEKEIDFAVDANATLPETMHTDQQRLEQIIKNLLSNAYKFTPKNGRIRMLLNPVWNFKIADNKIIENGISIAVIDTGIGISKDKQRMIFEAFQQADGTTSRKYGGTGLGLSISKELVKRLGGEIQLESTEGAGSTFTIILPLYKNNIEEDVSVSTKEDVPVPAVHASITEQTALKDDRASLVKNDKVMLIIEDDPVFAGILQGFAHTKGYKTVIALQGDEGLHYARKYKPTAITLDMQLPVINGWSLLKLLKSDPQLKQIPVHIISAADEDSLKVSGALAYLKKPVSLEDLEGAFALIGKNVQSNLKNILVFSGDYLKDDSLKELISDRHHDIVCDYVTTEEEGLQQLEEKNYDCLIADLGKDVGKNIASLQRLQLSIGGKQVPVIIYIDHDLSAGDEMQLRKLSNVIIKDSSHAKDRLLDELELFLYKVQEVENKGTIVKEQAVIDDNFFSHKKVLVVDDDMRNIFALTMLLEQHNMDVVTANDGREALEMLNQNDNVDIVLMDIMMPEMDGYEAMKRIRLQKKYASLPIIALTAKAMQGDRKKAIEAGATDYISKPVDSTKLISIMRVWLSK